MKRYIIIGAVVFLTGCAAKKTSNTDHSKSLLSNTESELTQEDSSSTKHTNVHKEKELVILEPETSVSGTSGTKKEDSVKTLSLKRGGVTFYARGDWTWMDYSLNIPEQKQSSKEVNNNDSVSEFYQSKIAAIRDSSLISNESIITDDNTVRYKTPLWCWLLILSLILIIVILIIYIVKR